MNKAKEPAVQAMLNMLNTLAKDHDVHISSDNEMYLKVDGRVVGLMYYDATEKRYVVGEVIEQEPEATLHNLEKPWLPIQPGEEF